MIGDVNAADGEAVANIIKKEGGYVCLLLFLSLVGPIQIDRDGIYLPTLQGSGFDQVRCHKMGRASCVVRTCDGTVQRRRYCGK